MMVMMLQDNKREKANIMFVEEMSTGILSESTLFKIYLIFMKKKKVLLFQPMNIEWPS